ncbi:L-seryl-tRNA(Sec) selenium transferase [Armatimonas sp.]|uniref:L-seryl-tRNA(Sec) selenium transferase n=1 Tax=Armatimonas sp. TaxID=1872638 RepID=UPI0037500C68
MTFRDLPSVEKLSTQLSELTHELAVAVARQAIDEAREHLKAGESVGDLPARARELATEMGRNQLRRAINATGVLLHTNLGRATLAPSAAAAVAAVAAGHATLEVDEETGGRGSRQTVIAQLLRELTGAEDAVVVNNNAAATVLALAAIACGKDVILSRGELVEIGGHFRLPDVIVQSGARLVEVGTTNRTRIGDYEAALTENTGMLLRCHPSNFRIVGFTESASLEELVALSRKSAVPFGDDIGSGALVDFSPFGLTDEPQVQKSVSAGADLVWFSGDKLLGGPQAGILVGRKDLIALCKTHPLMRALRPDKLTLAALEATLRLYRTGRAWDEVPILRRIRRDDAEIARRCRILARKLQKRGYDATVEATFSQVGGGSLPDRRLPSHAVVIRAENLPVLARMLRQAATPVYGRIEKDRLLLDLRAVNKDEEETLLHAFPSLDGGLGGGT